MFNPRAWAEVRLDRVKRNLGAIRRTVGPQVEVMAVIKADAYGHGAVPVARAALDGGAAGASARKPHRFDARDRRGRRPRVP